MKTNIPLIILFIIMVAAQLLLPAGMILNQEQTLSDGKRYKFRTQPIDPNDPFRGKFISLDFDIATFSLHDSMEWEPGETVYVLLAEDEKGFAKIRSLQKEAPGADEHDYVKAETGRFSGKIQSGPLRIQYPFNRFYMEESKAPLAEEVYREFTRDTSVVTYADVFVKNGEAVLKDVIINDTSIVDHINRNRPQ